VFVSNTLDHRQDYAARLTAMGVPTDPVEIVHAPLALIRYLERHHPQARLFVIGLPPLLEQLADSFRLSEDPEAIDVVVASIDYGFDFPRLNIAFQALRRGARLLATNTDPTWPTPEGDIPDAGAIVGALKACSRREVDAVVGKPSLWMAQLALAQLGCGAQRAWMVGDSLESDMAMGAAAGMTTAIVLTGVTRRQDLDGAEVQVDHVLESLADLPARLQGFRG
jgi:arabinose operon protein AraL